MSLQQLKLETLTELRSQVGTHIVACSQSSTAAALSVKSNLPPRSYIKYANSCQSHPAELIKRRQTAVLEKSQSIDERGGSSRGGDAADYMSNGVRKREPRNARSHTQYVG
eukprot:6186173-Pleurochrysis_carterae.AAC.8